MSESEGYSTYIIWDFVNRKLYEKGVWLGEGTFGPCFEIKDPDNGKRYAANIISKDLITQKGCKDELMQEISIHNSLKHRHIVELYSYFSNVNYIYVLLELGFIVNMEMLLTQRNRLTIPEVKYYMIQVLNALQYLHKYMTVHRNLNLGNIYIDEHMDIKIGDFGMAVKLQHRQERMLAICGTPNYIAPEILERTGHGFEVDVWSFGCIVYTLLEGSPPFSGEDIGEIYKQTPTYSSFIPNHMDPLAANMLRQIFVRVPKLRPKVKELLGDPYFTMGFVPESLPLSSLDSTPQFDTHLPTFRPSLMPLNSQNVNLRKQIFSAKSIEFLNSWKNRILTCLKNKPKGDVGSDTRTEDSTIQPKTWIHSWLDHSRSYGLGYRLNDGSVGILFKDNTSLIVDLYKNIYYSENCKEEVKYSWSSYPAKLVKKMLIYEHFKNNFNNVNDIEQKEQPSEDDCYDPPPIVTNWRHYNRSIVMLISNDTFQTSCFAEQSKTMLSGHLEAVTVMDGKSMKTYKFDLIEEHGCTMFLECKLWDLYKKICLMFDQRARAIIKTQPFSE